MLTAHDAYVTVGLAVAVAAAGGVAGWLLLDRRARRWSLRAALVVLVGTPVLVMAVGVSVAAALMVVSGHALVLLLAVTAAAAVTAAVAGAVLAVRIERLDDAQRRLAETRDRDRAAEAGRRELLTWVSHDLRAPLAAIRAMVEALDDEVVTDPATVGDYHLRIRREVDRLSRMVGDVFELSRITAGSLQLHPEPVAVDAVVGEVVAAGDSLARRRGVRLASHVAGHPVALADHRHLVRVLTNLVGNAVRHTPEGGGVHVAGADDGDAVLLSVSDGCGGIAEPDLARVFDTGYRGEAARTPRQDGGSGIGLAIARGIVEAHGGTITVRNVDGGCRFDVRLPAGSSGHEPAGVPSAAVPSGPVRSC
ncbi:MAG: sensor histidine kinase [Frankiaceae bacterium]